MKKYTFIVALASLIACGGGNNNGGMDRSERIEIIKGLEDKAFQDVENFDTTMALALVNNYAKFAEENPEDDLTPNFIFKAGDLSMALRKSNLAIGYFSQIIENYPEFERLPYCMFLKAFIYEDQIGDLEKAKAGYEEFIRKYPDHDMAEAARFSIKNLGKSPEDLINEFEQNRDTTEAGI